MYLRRAACSRDVAAHGFVAPRAGNLCAGALPLWRALASGSEAAGLRAARLATADPSAAGAGPASPFRAKTPFRLQADVYSGSKFNFRAAGCLIRTNNAGDPPKKKSHKIHIIARQRDTRKQKRRVVRRAPSTSPSTVTSTEESSFVGEADADSVAR